MWTKSKLASGMLSHLGWASESYVLLSLALLVSDAYLLVLLE